MKTHHEKNHVIIGLDVGTTKVCSVICSIDTTDDNPKILGMGTGPTRGMRKGTVIDIEKATESIRQSLDEAKINSPFKKCIKAIVGISGPHVYSFNSTGVISISGELVEQRDLISVQDAACALAIPDDREILDRQVINYKVDSLSAVKNPLGMRGKALSAEVHIVTIDKSAKNNLLECCRRNGLDKVDLVLQSWASSMAIMGSTEKEMGVCLVDIGGGTTDVAIWNNGPLIYDTVVPIGGNHFSNDLSIGLKISREEAEKIKVQHGHVIVEQINPVAHVTLQGMVGSRPREAPLVRVGEILNARAIELLETIRNILEERGLLHHIAGGIILTGGGSLLKGMVDLSEKIFQLPTKVGPPQSAWPPLTSPKFSTVWGLILKAQGEGVRGRQVSEYVNYKDFKSLNQNSAYQNEYQNEYQDERTLPRAQVIAKRLSHSIRQFFSEIF